MKATILKLLSQMDQGNYPEILETINAMDENEPDMDIAFRIFRIEIVLLQGDIDTASQELKLLEQEEKSNLERMIIITQQAIVNWLKGNVQVANDLVSTAKELEITNKDHPLYHYWLSYMYNASGLVYILLGNPKQAKIELDKAYTYAKKSGSLRKITSSMDNLAIVHRLLGNFDVAIFYQDESLELRLEMDDKHGIALSKGNLAELYEITGELQKSLEYSKEIIPLFKEFGTAEEVGMCYHNIGRVYFQLNDLISAEEYFETAFQYRQKAGNKVRLSVTMYFRILIAINLQKFDRAKGLLEEFSQYPLEETKVINLNYQLARAHYLIAKEDNLRDAEHILTTILETNDFDIELNIISMITLIKLYSINFNVNRKKIRDIIIRLKKLSHSKNNAILEIELLILEAKLALLQQDIHTSLELLEKAGSKATDHKFKRIIDKVEANKEFIGTHYNEKKSISLDNIREFLDQLLRNSHGY